MRCRSRSRSSGAVGLSVTPSQPNVQLAASPARFPGDLAPVEVSVAPTCEAEFQGLREKLNSNGYLYVRGLIPREDVAKARLTVLEDLHSRGILTAEQVESGKMVAGKEAKAIHLHGRGRAARSRELMAVVDHERLRSFFEGLLDFTGNESTGDDPALLSGRPARSSGRGVLTYDYKWLRAVSPGEYTGPHLDWVYMGRGTSNLLTCWIPLDDVEAHHLGGLAVLQGSNKCAALQKMRDTYGRMEVETFRSEDGRPYKGSGWICSDPLSDPALQKSYSENGTRWVTASSYSMGDVVIFLSHTLHASMANLSDPQTDNRLRLSCDTRWQRACEEVDERWFKPIGDPEPDVAQDFGGAGLSADKDKSTEFVTIQELRENWGI